MTCITIDDEPLALQLLQDNISRIPYLQHLGGYRNALEALKVMADTQVDLIFLDIQMPMLTGLEFVKTLDKKPLIILITAYKQYALEGYDLDITDYLVKPVAFDRLLRACNRAKEQFDLQQNKKTEAGSAEKTYMFLTADYKQVKILFADITYIEGLRDYVRIHLKLPARPLLFRTGLRSIEMNLPASKFIRIHKSYIVAIEHITSVNKTSIFLGDLELPIGDTFRPAVGNLLGKKDL
ncbi:MAG: response regulator transcription factor [Bacteroidota bacterium]|nr:response regulator transcription factor [Bacteroidota bacterium]